MQKCLKDGYKVRVSVRKEEQVQSLKHQFASHAGELDFVVIPDISKTEAFGNALRDVDYVLHIASPMPGKGDDFKTDYLRPSVDGTQAILRAAKASNGVKRVIITSSILANIPLGEMNATDLHVKGMSETVDSHIASVQINRQHGC